MGQGDLTLPVLTEQAAISCSALSCEWSYDFLPSPFITVTRGRV